MVAQHAQLVRAFLAVGRDQAAVAEAAQVLAREETEGTELAEAAGHLAVDVGAERLRAVLDDDQAPVVAEFFQCIHVHRLAEQVHRDHGPGFRRDRLLDLVQIDVEGVGVDVHEHRRRADIADGLGRGDEGERRGDDFVAFADAGRGQREVQGVGTRGHADRVFDAEVVGGFLLKGLHVRAENKLGCLQRVEQGAVDFVFEREVLALEVDHRDVHSQVVLLLVFEQG